MDKIQARLDKAFHETRFLLVLKKAEEWRDDIEIQWEGGPEWFKVIDEAQLAICPMEIERPRLCLVPIRAIKEEKAMNKAWRVARAWYDADADAVEEIRIASFDTANECLSYVNANGEKPIMGYHENCMDLDVPQMAYVATDAYRREYAKLSA